MTPDSKFYWASIGGADPEPVEVTTLDGREVAYTLGCPDPFFMDERDCPVRLGSVRSPRGHMPACLDFKEMAHMRRPKLPNKQEAEILAEEYQEREAARARALLPQHSWRGPR